MVWWRSNSSNFLTQMAINSQSAQANENHRREDSRQTEMRRAEEKEKQRLNMKRNRIRQAQQTPTPLPSMSVISLHNKPPPVLPSNITKDLIMRARTGKSTNDGQQMMKILGDVIKDAITLTRKLDTNANVKAMFAKGRDRQMLPNVESFNENKNWQDLMAAVTTRYGWDFEWGKYVTSAMGGSAKTYSTPFGTIKVKIYWRSHVPQRANIPRSYSNLMQTTYDPVIYIETKWHSIRLDRQFPRQIRKSHSRENTNKWPYKHSSPSDKFYYTIEKKKEEKKKNNIDFGFESEKIELGFLKAVLAKNSDVVALSNWKMDGTRLNFSGNGLPKASMYHRRPPGEQ